MRFKHSLILIALLSIATCSPPEAEVREIAPESSAPALRSSLLVTGDWLEENLNNPELVVLHVSTSPAVYDSGHVPGALYVGWDRLTRTENGVSNELPPVDSLTALLRDLGIDRGKRVVIYDEVNGIPAARVFFTLDYMGLGDNAALLDGQLAAWKEAGRTLSTVTPEVTRSSFVPEVNNRVLITMDELAGMVGSESGKQLLDCRPPDQYSGEKPGRDIERGGHIPGAYNVPVSATIQSAEMPLLKAPDQLRAMYSQAGFSGESQVVTYCRTGRSASLTYFVLKYLGYDVRLYDGSFSQWQGDSLNPVESSSGQ